MGITGREGRYDDHAFALAPGLAVLVALGFQCFLVNAQEQQQAISGIGAQRCAILNARATAGPNPHDTAAVLIWIEGFISGFNMNAENDFYYDLTSVTTAPTRNCPMMSPPPFQSPTQKR